MWKRVKDGLDAGVEKVKWFSTLINERVRVELSLFKLLHQSSEMEKRKAELLRSIGEKVFELRNLPEKLVLGDPVIMQAMSDLETLDAEIDELKKRASEIEKIDV